MHLGWYRLRVSMHDDALLMHTNQNQMWCVVVIIQLARLDKGGKDGHALCITTNTTNTIILSGHGAPSKLLPVVTPYILLPNQFAK